MFDVWEEQQPLRSALRSRLNFFTEVCRVPSFLSRYMIDPLPTSVAQVAGAPNDNTNMYEDIIEVFSICWVDDTGGNAGSSAGSECAS